MLTLTKATKQTKKEDVKRNWHLIDLDGKVLGRAVSQIAYLLQGKHKLDYTPHVDMGDYVVVVNAKKVVLTGRKKENKIYKRYSGYPGGLKRITFTKLLDRKPEDVVKHAVSGMLPKNKLRSRRLLRLFVFSQAKHPYQDKFQITNS